KQQTIPLKEKKLGIAGLIDDVNARISFMERQKRRNKSEEFHGYVNGVIDDYKRWIEYLRCLNEFDAAVKEDLNDTESQTAPVMTIS
ncbi:22347_t:CDS:1, partial [Gigaspora rosea]